MAYITGTITNSDPGPTLYAAMAPALTTAGFTLVDTVVISTRTHKVWKSAAANNTQGLDWYLDIGYPTNGAGALCLQCFEFFDPATDLGYRGLHSASGTTVDATTFSRYGATGNALETNWVGSPTFTAYPTPIPATTFGYWISITGDRVVLLQSNDASQPTYVGFYQADSLYAAKAGAALYPLIGARLQVGGSSSGSVSAANAALTRIPPSTTIASWASHVQTEPFTASYIRVVTPAVPTGSTVMYPMTAWPIGIASIGSSLPPSAWYGTFRDTYSTTTNGVVRGDTCTIGGSQYVLSTTASVSSFLFKAA